MENNYKKIFIVLIICALNISLFAENTPATINYYWNFSSELEDTYELQEIPVTNLYSSNNKIDSNTINYYGYKMGSVTVDFGDTNALYYSTFKDTYKRLSLNQEGGFFYSVNSYVYGGRIVVSDLDGNQSTVSGFIKITKKNKNGTIIAQEWYDTTNLYEINFSYDSNFGYTKTDSFTMEYYFIINHMGYLNTDEALSLYVPSKTISQWSTATLRIGTIKGNVDLWTSTNAYLGTVEDPILNSCISNTFYIYNPIYTKSGIASVGSVLSDSDTYELNVDIQKIFDDDSIDFFDGEIHDYYSLNFDSYKFKTLTEDPFTLCLEISSAHDWYLHLDNKDNPTDAEKIKYTLYLRYNANSKKIKIKDNQSKILIKNIISSSLSSTISLSTLCKDANSNKNTKGTYQDDVYINFITDNWKNSEESTFADKTITLSN